MGKTKAIMNRTTDLMGSNAQKELTAMASKLQHLLSGGQRLNKAQAIELAVYSYMTDLNPFNNEVYYIPRVGPYPGIAGYIRKAIEQMEYEGGETARGYRLNFEDRPAEPNEADFDPDKGDIAYYCKMTNTIDTENWQQRKWEIAGKYKELGADFQSAIEEAEKDVGPKPYTTGIGVVDHRENFSASGKPEMWDRHERAKKRAHKNAIRKRFTMVMIPEPDEAQPGEIVDVQVVDRIRERLDEMEQDREDYNATHSAADSIEELGFSRDDGSDFEDGDFRAAEEAEEEEEPRISVERPFSPQELKEAMTEWAGLYKNADAKASDRDRKILAKHLNTYFKGDETKRYEFSKTFLGAASTGDMEDGYVLAAKETWLGAEAFDMPGSEHELVEQEIEPAHAWAMKQEGQQEMEM